MAQMGSGQVTVTVRNSEFSNFISTNGSILSIIGQDNSTSTLTIESSNFTNNAATTNGGVFYIDVGDNCTVAMSIQNHNIFTNNSATNGGVGYLNTAENAVHLSLSWESNTFDSNVFEYHMYRPSENMRVNTIVNSDKLLFQPVTKLFFIFIR